MTKDYPQTISQINRDAFGENLPMATRLQMWRLRKWQIRSRVHSSIDRNLAQAMSELDRLTGKVYIPPSIKEKAAVIYRKGIRQRLGPRKINQCHCRKLQFMLLAAEAEHREPFAKSQRRVLLIRSMFARCYRLLLQELDVHMPVSESVDIRFRKLQKRMEYPAKHRVQP